MDWTPGQACRRAGELADEHDYTAVHIILVHRGKDGETQYVRRHIISGLNTLDSLALLHIGATDMVDDIKNIPPKLADGH